MEKTIRILFIEDNEDDIILIISALQKYGYKCSYKSIYALTEIEKSLSEEEWDIILSDYKLPGFTGMDVLRTYKDLDYNIPFIIISGAIETEKAVSLLKAGVDDYVSKDNISFIAPAVERAIRKRRELSLKAEMEKELQKQHSLLKTILNTNPVGIALVDDSGNFIFVNNKAEEILGIHDKNIEEKISILISNIGDFVFMKGDRDASIVDMVKELRKPLYDSVHILRKKTPKRYLSLNASPIFDRDNNTTSIIISIQDISQRVLNERKIKYLSFHDKLTGLYNRAYFEEELNRLDTERQLPLSIIIGDLNGLKLLNDSFGHSEGDRILRDAARIIRDSCRNEDIVARWGGDEFAILLPNTEGLTAKILIDRIREKCRNYSNLKIPLSVSFGFSTKIYAKDNVENVIKSAENNMYKIKLLERKDISNTIISHIEKSLVESGKIDHEHTNNMKKLALMLGNELNLTKDELNNLSLLAELHDIGKISISNDILQKSDKLTDKEWKVIKKHPEIGYNIAHTSVILAPIAEAILTHHEWWNKNGYPQGLKGEHIPVISRILSIVEAYEVMRNGTSYKKPVSKKSAIDELKKYSSIQFDPELVSKFLEVLKKEDKQS